MERQVSIRLPAALLAKIDARARRIRRRRSDVIRGALIRFFELPPALSEGRPFDRVRDLIGSVKGAPRDLSTNPKYMNDLGRDGR